mmetsp:Transcript_14320/g.27053  ORF Transcript_14320/g.27053 Transcript_14320/m.27053 type:complete len:194 (-) Transcript_14320:107-688(-)
MTQLLRGMKLAAFSHIVSSWNPDSLLAWYWMKPMRTFLMYGSSELLALIVLINGRFNEIQIYSQSVMLVVIIIPAVVTVFHGLFAVNRQVTEAIPASVTRNTIRKKLCGRFLISFAMASFVLVAFAVSVAVPTEVFYAVLQMDKKLVSDHIDATVAILGSIFISVFWEFSEDDPREVGDEISQTLHGAIPLDT